MFKKLRIYCQHVLPQHLLSRLAGCLAESQTPWIKNFLIFLFMKSFKNIDMSIATISDPYAYSSFNHFFIRQLKPTARPIAEGKKIIVLPADGTIAQIGYINKTTLVQAKNFYFDLSALLADDSALVSAFTDGAYATIYLAPYNYHRVHMPSDGKLKKTIYVPGKLFSVNKITSEFVPNLYSRNERLICLFETAAGPMVVILVGAMIVGSIQTVWMKAPIRSNSVQVETFDNGMAFRKGDELGYFKIGSTVILLFEKARIQWFESVLPGSMVDLGEKMGIISKETS